MESWCSDYTGLNRRYSKPSSSTSRSPPINLPRTSQKIRTHPTIKKIDASYTIVPIPVEWDNVNSDKLVAHGRYNVTWELHENVLPLVSSIRKKEAAKDLVKRWPVSIRRSFVV
jgi:hypothetical protein